MQESKLKIGNWGKISTAVSVWIGWYKVSRLKRSINQQTVWHFKWERDFTFVSAPRRRAVKCSLWNWYTDCILKYMYFLYISDSCVDRQKLEITKKKTKRSTLAQGLNWMVHGLQYLGKLLRNFLRSELLVSV